MKRIGYAALVAGVLLAACVEEQTRVKKLSVASAEAMRSADAGTAATADAGAAQSVLAPAPPAAANATASAAPSSRHATESAGSPAAASPVAAPAASGAKGAPQAQPAAPASARSAQAPAVQPEPPAPEPVRPAAQESNAQGIRILQLPPSQQPVVSLQLRFKSGAVDDPPGKSGATQLAAQLMAEGGTQALDAKALRKALFPMAAELSVRVDKEETTFIARVHRDHLAALLPILTDVLLHPRWDPGEFKRLREDAVNDVEKQLRQNSDEALGKEALAAQLYRDHPYGRLTEGHASDLKSLSLDDLRAQAQRVFTRDRLTVGLAGGAPDGLAGQLAQALAALPEKGDKPVAIPAARPRGPRFLLVEKDADSTAVSMGFPYALSRKDPDFAALSLARSAFGEHRQENGRLMQRLRELRGLNYGDYAYLEYFQQEGWDASQAQSGRARHQQEFTIWLRPIQEQSRLFAVRAALYELSRSLHEEPFSEAEVAQTKGFLDGYLLLFDQTDARRLGYALDDDFYGMSGFLGAWHAALHPVTAAQVNAAWKKWIDPAKLEIVLAGREMAKVKSAILSNEATPIHYDPALKPPREQLASDAAIEKFPFGASGEADVKVVPVADLFE